MAGNLINTLYPPIVDTFMPAFVNVYNGYIYFSLSPYNENTKITRIHVSLIDASTNQYAFRNINNYNNQGIYITQGILIYPFELCSFDETSGLYTIPINVDWLAVEITDAGNELLSTWQIERYYQAQLRLDSSSETISEANNYILQERQNFSEWSSVTLLRPILQPMLLFQNFDEPLSSTSEIQLQEGNDGTTFWAYKFAESPTYNKGWVDINAKVVWQNGTPQQTDSGISYSWESKKTTEYLDNYRITIFTPSTQDNPIVDSGVIYMGNKEKDSIYYLADMNQASQSTTYILRIDAESRNGYKWYTEKKFVIASFVNDDWGLDWDFNTIRLNTYHDESDVIVTEEDGFVECTVKSKYDMRPGWLYIYRSSSVDNYQKNEIIQVTAQNGQFTQTFQDKTVCSLINYRYKAQYKFKVGYNWTPVALSPTYVYPQFYDMLFLRQDKQLAIRFDGQVSNFKQNINRVKIDTIGGKYPKFAENARMDYKSFSISGVLSSEEDFNRQFMSDFDEEFEASLAAYDDNIGNVYQLRNDTIISSYDHPFKEATHDTYLHDNWYWEREFRERASAWLNDGEPKLFRSMTEGNMIVMVTDVSMTPKAQLGRRLYDFSATVYEIADGMSIDEIAGYGIIDIRNDETDTSSNRLGYTDDEMDTRKMLRLGQYHGKAHKASNSDIVLDTLHSESSQDTLLDIMSIKDILNAEYSGINKNLKVKDGSIKLHDLKIQFTTPPNWMYADKELNFVTFKKDDITGADIVDYSDGKDETSPKLLGYKFEIQTTAQATNPENISSVNTQNLIFVGPKGYYQIPSDIEIARLIFYAPSDGLPVEYDLDYTIEYQLEYDNSQTAIATELVKNVVGQYAGQYNPGIYYGDTIRDKYRALGYATDNNITRLASLQYMRSWSGISFDVTPYGLLEYTTDKDSEVTTVLIGRTGVFNMMTDFPVYDFRFLGRRMIEAPHDNRPYLDEWEYRLDDGLVIEEEGVENKWRADLQNSIVFNATQQPNEPVIVNYHSERNPTIIQRILPYNIVEKTRPKAGSTNELETFLDVEFIDWETSDITFEEFNEHNTIFAEGTEVENATISDDNFSASTEWTFYYAADIENPQFNTVYKLASRHSDASIYVIYYLDHAFYQVEFLSDNTILAKVPIYGMVNYRGTVIKNTYGS